MTASCLLMLVYKGRWCAFLKLHLLAFFPVSEMSFYELLPQKLGSIFISFCFIASPEVYTPSCNLKVLKAVGTSIGTSHQAWGPISSPPLAQAVLTLPPHLLSIFSNSFANYSSITCNSDRRRAGAREQQCACSVLALKVWHWRGKIDRETSHWLTPQPEPGYRVTLLTWKSKF